MKTKLKKPSKFDMVNMEQMLHDLLVDIMERYDYDIEQAQELINTVVEIDEEIFFNPEIAFKKQNIFFMIHMERTLYDLKVDIMERYDYDIEQAQELISTVVEAQAEEIKEEAEANDVPNTIKKLKQQLGE